MTSEEKRRIRIAAGIGLATTIVGGVVGYYVAQKHRAIGAVVGVFLAPAVSIPFALLVAPDALEKPKAP